MKHMWKYITGVCVCALLMAATAFAADSDVAETYTGEDYISVYFRNAGEADEAKAQVGTSPAEIDKIETLADSSVEISTLIMIDNSISIKKDQQDKIAELVQDMIGGLSAKEQVAVATFGEQINYLTGYSNNYGELKQAFSGITYQDQETYLTDVLYNVLRDDIHTDKEERFYRIVIISDGVDNKPVGVTKEELYQQLADNRIPVYTIGCKEKKNEEQLENMFALSRITGTQFFVLDDIENTLDVVNTLSQDQGILRVRIKPEPGDMDGSIKTVKVSIGESDVQTEVRMPQQEMVVEEPESEPEEEPEPEPEEETEVPEEEPEQQSKGPLIVIICLAGVVAIGLIVAIILLIRAQKKRNGNVSGGSFETFEGYGDLTDNDPDNKTVLLGGNQRTYDLILEDMMNPARVFQIPINEGRAIIIGRNQESCDICIDYERSISGRHCRISVKNDKFYITDLQSSNGTFLNDNRVITDSELIAGNILRLGALQFRVSIR